MHAFAEEMNKSRRMVSLAARALAERGWAVLLLDLAGCGDSSGDFGEATWGTWIGDAVHAHRWMDDRFGGVCWLWGLRAGCLIAAQAADQIRVPASLLLWQPVLTGRSHLTQFLRLKLAEQALNQAALRTGTKELRVRLAGGESVEIAGHALGPSLAAGLEQAELATESRSGQLVWLEVSTEDEPRLLPASDVRIAALRARGARVEACVVKGLPFWQTVEIAEAPELIRATVSGLESH